MGSVIKHARYAQGWAKLQEIDKHVRRRRFWRRVVLWALLAATFGFAAYLMGG